MFGIPTSILSGQPISHVQRETGPLLLFFLIKVAAWRRFGEPLLSGQLPLCGCHAGNSPCLGADRALAAIGSGWVFFFNAAAAAEKADAFS